MFAGDSTRIGRTKESSATITTAAICRPPASYGGLNARGRNANSFDIEMELGGVYDQRTLGRRVHFLVVKRC